MSWMSKLLPCLRQKTRNDDLSTTQAVERLQAMTPLIVDRYFELQVRQKILEPMMFDKRLAESIGKSYAANAWNFLVQSLFLDQIRGICALTWDDDTRTYSVRNALRFLSRPDVKEAIRSQETEPSPIVPSRGEPDLSDEFRTAHLSHERQELEARFDQNFEELMEAWRGFGRLAFRKKMQTVRNKVIAHHELVEGEDKYESVNIEEFGLKWGDVGKCLKALAPVVFKLEVACRSHSYAEDQYEEIHEKWAQDLWDRLIPDEKRKKL
jgi:hypothetical protein